MNTWNQIYNPLGNAGLSTLAAAVPVVTLLVLIASGKVKAHIAAIIAVIRNTRRNPVISSSLTPTRPAAARAGPPWQASMAAS